MNDDRLSAYLDGELSPEEADALRAELDSSPELRAELARVDQARDWVRALPAVEIPADFEFVPAARPTVSSPPADEAEPASSAPLAPVVSLDSRRWRRRAMSVVSAAAVFFLVLGFASGLPGVKIVPAVDGYIDRHAAASEAMPAPAVDDVYAAVDMDDMDDMDDMPDLGSVVDEPMMGAYRSADVLHVLYGDESSVVSVFREHGSLDVDGLGPADRMDMDGGEAWHVRTDAAEVFVTERDGVVYTVVSSAADVDMAMKMTDGLPDPPQSFWGRFGDGAGKLWDLVA